MSVPGAVATGSCDSLTVQLIRSLPLPVLTQGNKVLVYRMPYDEFTVIQEALADADDLNELRIAKNEKSEAPTVPLEEVISSLGL